ncbi:hypothetical protein BHE74_00058478, partial [Ensete ventricosum]
RTSRLGFGILGRRGRRAERSGKPRSFSSRPVWGLNPQNDARFHLANKKMAVPLLTKKIVKKRVKQFKRPQSDRKICVKVRSFIFNLR